MELDIVRAWKDARYRRSLTPEQQAMLPENPVGPVELTDADLEAIQGQGSSPGGDQVGSMSMQNCLFSLGGGDYSCNTFAKAAGSCVNAASHASAISDFFKGMVAVMDASHLF
jgi:mersacidin/lichenicidin family type 2 lantibiotic